jgi:hypothetical protein
MSVLSVIHKAYLTTGDELGKCSRAHEQHDELKSQQLSLTPRQY